ncbi:hypothetical protein RND81_08G004000 [Saponaria officinalis]|uniref:Peptidase A1 domain-containing protein n=1 Tax=Saponaria officinalis TaxID=3572 RepID=A0AAW1J1Q8_SAPOF
MAIKMSFLLISSLISFLFLVNPSLSLNQGFSTDLIHRESPLSPLSTPYFNKYDRLRNSINRSMSRVNRFKTFIGISPNDVQTQVIGAQGEYVMKLSLGTPPVTEFGIADTGSDLIWLQCQPCLQCYTQTLPIFDPRKSSTYKTQSCDSEACQALNPSQSSCSSNNVCNYLYGYGDKSHTSGDIATETITFNSGKMSNGTSFPKIIFGCGHDNAGTFQKDGSGLFGLGGGPLSLVSQLSPSINGKFSYCLIPFFDEGNYMSTINFGTSGAVSGRGVISTPLVKGDRPTFYYLTLNAVTVGKSKIPFSKNPSTNDEFGSSNQGNVIIDSGTTLTLLPPDLFDDLYSAIKDAVQGEEVDDPTGFLKLCYQSGVDGLNIPDMIAHFDGGDVTWKPINTFVQVSKGVTCLAIVPADEQIGAIIGNIAQVNYLIGYDLVEGKVSFKPTDCTKH